MRVYFSCYADQKFFIEIFASFINENWEILSSRDLNKLLSLWNKSIRTPMFESAAKIKDPDKKARLHKIGSIVLAHAILGEVLQRWPNCFALDVEFIEPHAFALDKQIRYFEFTGDRALFFALCHVGTGILCQESEEQSRNGTKQPFVFTRIDPRESFSIADLLVDVLLGNHVIKNINIALKSEADMQAHFAIATKELFRGAEAIQGLSNLV